MAATQVALPVIECCAPIAGPDISDDEATAIADVFKALSDPHRVRIFNMLANSGSEVCVCDITDEIGLSQPTVSHHLKKLTTAGLLDRSQRGVWAYYSIKPDAMDKLGRVVETTR
jgi:ArsR family transcriptional regulator, arsenate/arsenite/antimonite-responsive transcriptional repressor